MTAHATVLIQKRRLRSICLIASWRASCSLVAGAFEPPSVGVSWEVSWSISTPSFGWEPSDSSENSHCSLPAGWNP